MPPPQEGVEVRVFLAVAAMSLLGAYYYLTKDLTPLTSFAGIYAAYELVSRVRKVEFLKIPLLFGLIFISMRTGFQYLGYPENAFVYLISAGFALSLPVLKHRLGFIPGIAGIVLIGAAFMLVPDVYPVNQLRLPIALSAAVIALTTIMPAVSERMEFLIDHRPFLVFLTLITSIYYTQFRETLYPGFRNLGDWVVVASALMYFLGKFRFDVDEVPAETSEIPDFDGFAESAERAYVEGGDPVPLLTFISYTLFRSGKDVKDLERFFRVFVDREKVPRYSFGFERQLILRRRRAKRAERLDRVKRMFEEIGGGDERG